MIWAIFSLACFITLVGIVCFWLGYKVGLYRTVQELHESNQQVTWALKSVEDTQGRLKIVIKQYEGMME